MHPEWTIKTVEAGKHGITEKPFAANVAQMFAVHEATEKAGVKIMEAFMWRFHPMHLRARQWVQEEAIGKIRLFRTAFTFNIARSTNIRLDPALAGGGIMDVGCYCISEARYFFGAEPYAVYANADMDAEFGVDMLASGTLLFEKGRALFDCGFELPYRCDYEIVGEKGRIYCPNAILPGENAELYLYREGAEAVHETFPGINQWSLEFEHLSRSIVEGTPLAYDTQDAIKQQKVIDAVYRSAQSGKREDV
jgi:predicted dehydrogenase